MTSMRPSMRQALVDYLNLRRALGFRLVSVGRILNQFVAYLEEHHLDTVTVEQAWDWATLPAGSAHWHAMRLRAVRGFVTYLHGLDPAIPIPQTGLIRCGPCRATPYLYSATDIRALLQAADRLKPRLRAATYHTLIGLLAVTGIRIGEAIALDDTDLDAEQQLLVVRHTKFDKTRLIPLHPTTLQALQSYQQLRRQHLPRPASPALLVSTRGTRLLHSNIALVFSGLLNRTGLALRSTSCRPRIHDIRHSFAVATVLNWYRDGDDVASLMPYLSTYLGHTNPQHTFWYLSAAPELMALAAHRLHTHLGGDLK